MKDLYNGSRCAPTVVTKTKNAALKTIIKQDNIVIYSEVKKQLEIGSPAIYKMIYNHLHLKKNQLTDWMYDSRRFLDFKNKG